MEQVGRTEADSKVDTPKILHSMLQSLPRAQNDQEVNYYMMIERSSKKKLSHFSQRVNQSTSTPFTKPS
jgi:hypothetical protein